MERKIYGLLGRKLGHSWSVPIHRALGCGDYRLIELEPGELERFLRRADIGGLNVTIPYKRDVMPFCDVIDAGARAIGSVNTLVRREDGKLYGYNTDIDGFLYMLRRAEISLRDKKAVILGSGGASLTVRAAAAREGAREIVTVSRNGPDNYGNLERHADAEVLINATPVGMWPNLEGRPADLRLFPKVSAVADVIYNPGRTNLLLQAEEICRTLQALRADPAPDARSDPDVVHAAAKAGLTPEGREQSLIPANPQTGPVRYTGGLPMLVAQAARAEELFFDRTIPALSVDTLTCTLRREKTNIVLTGMPGCGKTTVGRELAKLSGRPLADLDEEIVRRAGKSIPEIFRDEGETSFRDLESRVLAETCARGGQIIATGGGAVLRFENRAVMRRTGRVYLLRRELAQLPTDGRPLSRTGSLAQMHRVREPMYRAAADTSFDNNSAAETAAAVWRDFCENSGR